MTFVNAHPGLVNALADRGYETPTPVQAAVLETGLAGRDLLVSAQTGSGKTVAFGLSMAPELLGEEARFEPTPTPLGLVVAPTRELAMQVRSELGWLYGPAGARLVACVGGVDIRRQLRALEEGAHLVIGTPGRLCDLLDRGTLDLSTLRAVVLDEADQMLDLGFREDLERLLDTAPPERRTLLFSATLPRGIVSIARRYQRDAARVATSADDEPHGDIDYRVLHVAPQERERAVVNVLRYFDARGAIVFCMTREAVKHLHANLLERGFSAVALSGELTQAERNRAMHELRGGRARVCVATDVAARGLDLPDLGLVIHADLPRDRATLLHRSGRTARAGRKGTCVILVAHPNRQRAARLLASAKIDAAWTAPPPPAAIRKKDLERLVEEVAALAGTAAEEDSSAVEALVAKRSPEELATALVRLQRKTLPAAEELTASGPADPRPPSGVEQRRPGRMASATPMSWFRMNIGRQQNADPRWLVPFLCRRGHITKRDIGAIRIGARETRFEIAEAAAPRFSAAALREDPKDPNIRIEAVQLRPKRGAARSGGGGDAPPRRRRPVGRAKQAGPATRGSAVKKGSAANKASVAKKRAAGAKRTRASPASKLKGR